MHPASRTVRALVSLLATALAAATGAIVLASPATATDPMSIRRLSVGQTGQQLVGPHVALAVSGDGSTAIHLANKFGANQVVVTNLATGAQRTLVSPTGTYFQNVTASLSDDGSRALLVNPGSNMFLVTTATGSTQTLPGAPSRAVISGDGSTVVTANNSTRRVQLHKISTGTTSTISSTELLASTAITDVTIDDTASRVVYRAELVGATSRMWVWDSGGITTLPSGKAPSLSGDGRFLVFVTKAALLSSEDTDSSQDDVYRYNFSAETFAGVSVRPGTALTPLRTDAYSPTVSEDGRFVVYDTGSNDQVYGDTNGVIDLFRKDMTTGATERIRASGQPNGKSVGALSSDDARVVVFTSEASNLVSGDTNHQADAFVATLAASVAVPTTPTTPTGTTTPRPSTQCVAARAAVAKALKQRRAAATRVVVAKKALKRAKPSAKPVKRKALARARTTLKRAQVKVTRARTVVKKRC